MKSTIKNIFVLILASILFLPATLSYGQGLGSNLIRVGLFYGASSRADYAVSGLDLFLSERDSPLWNSRSSAWSVGKAGNVYVSSRGERSYEDALYDGDAVYYKDGYFYPASLVDSGQGFSPLSGNNILISSDRGDRLIIGSSQDLTIKSSDGIIALNNTKYRDGLNIFYEGANLAAVNVIGMDNYLKGVIAKEMPASWPIEALKAQAVVAKGYAVTNMHKHTSQGFNVCATTHCQVYGGYSAETPSTNKAVDETTGVLMYHGGKPAEGYFHSSSGGRTENSGNIWNNQLPYLVGVDDPYSLGTPYDKWTASVSHGDIQRLLASNGLNIGSVTGAKISKTTENGRALELIIYGTSGNHVLQKDRIRIFFGANTLKSTYFTLEDGSTQSSASDVPKNDGTLNSIYKSLSAVIDAEKAASIGSFGTSGSLVFNGKGFGHGVGMSQYGAKTMAGEGHNYKEILKHYFMGIDIY